MFIQILFLFFPTCLTQSYCPTDAQHVLYGDLSSMDDLFLPESDDDLTKSEEQLVTKLDYAKLLRQTFEYEDDQLLVIENVTENSADAKEYNDATMRIYNITRRAQEKGGYGKPYGHDDFDDWYYHGEYIEDKKMKMFEKISLQYLYHARYMIDKCFAQRKPIRRSQRYRLGYLFNRLRRLKTEMLKVVAIANEQYKFLDHKFQSLMTLMRLYEKVAKFDVDIRDTSANIRRIYNDTIDPA